MYVELVTNPAASDFSLSTPFTYQDFYHSLAVVFATCAFFLLYKQISVLLFRLAYSITMRYSAILSLCSVWVCVDCVWKCFCCGIAAWYFWLAKLNMWQSSWKADLCPSVYKLMFKLTNAHLQLLLFFLSICPPSCLWHTHTLISSEVLLQGNWTEKHKILHSSFHQAPVKFRPQYADGSYGWRCIIFKEHKKIDAVIRSPLKVLLGSVKSLISHSPTYQLPHHQPNAMWETVVYISYHANYRSSFLDLISIYSVNTVMYLTCNLLIFIHGKYQNHTWAFLCSGTRVLEQIMNKRSWSIILLFKIDVWPHCVSLLSWFYMINKLQM